MIRLSDDDESVLISYSRVLVIDGCVPRDYFAVEGTQRESKSGKDPKFHV